MIRKFFFLSILLTLIFIAEFCEALSVKMLDVGQGEAFLIQTDSENILIDTGDAYYRDALLAQLADVHTIDYLILSHPHSDHIANAATLLKNKTVTAIYDNGCTSANKYYLNYLAQARKSGVPRYTLRVGDMFFLDDGAYIEILSANRFDKNPNNNSVICRLVYGNFSMLFTGDAEADLENSLTGAPIESTVLKAAHHGSKTSNSLDFVKAVNPQYVLISAGYGNKFGHPHAAALDNFILAGVPKQNIFCTAFNGAVTIDTDGNSFTVTPQRHTDWFDDFRGYVLSIHDIWSSD